MIYLNKKIINGPWGGGNKSVASIAKELESRSIPFTFKLTSDVKIIFCFDPRPNSEGLWYQNFVNHKIRHGSKIIQRVGDVGTHSKPELTQLLRNIIESKMTDLFIFPSEWAKNYLDLEIINYKIIKNMPKEIFFKNKKNNVVSSEKNKTISVVTHHWSTNPKKGFSVYEKIGSYIQGNKDIKLTYIGRHPNNFNTKGISIKNPMSDSELSIELPKHDVYFTASVEEAGANHVLEAIAAGLPIVYSSKGGSIPEYCNKFGIPFNEDPIESIKQCYYNNKEIFKNISSFNENINIMSKKYVDILEEELKVF